jgi:hypothetical protein
MPRPKARTGARQSSGLSVRVGPGGSDHVRPTSPQAQTTMVDDQRAHDDGGGPCRWLRAWRRATFDRALPARVASRAAGTRRNPCRGPYCRRRNASCRTKLAENACPASRPRQVPRSGDATLFRSFRLSHFRSASRRVQALARHIPGLRSPGMKRSSTGPCCGSGLAPRLLAPGRFAKPIDVLR